MIFGKSLPMFRALPMMHIYPLASLEALGVPLRKGASPDEWSGINAG